MRAFRFVSVASCLGLLWVGGCTCKGKPKPEPTVEITSPVEGAFIDSSEDVNPALVGLQIRVEVTTTNVTDQSEATIVVNDDTNLAKNAFVQGNRIVFDEVTLVPNAQGFVSLTVSVLDSDTGLSPRDAITVEVSPALIECAFLDPADSATLGPSDDADPNTRGFQYAVVLQCNKTLTGTLGNLSVDGRPVPSAIFAGTTVTFASVTFNEGINVLLGDVATASGSWSGSITVTVDTPDCEVRVEPSGGIVFNVAGDPPRLVGRTAIADGDSDPQNGIQADLSGTTPDCQGSLAALLVDGTEQEVVSITSTTVSFATLNLVDGQAVEVQIEVRESAPGGPTGISAPQRYWVDSVAPAPSVSFPADNSVVTPSSDKDGDITNGIQFDVVVDAVALERTQIPAQPDRSAQITVTLVDPLAGTSQDFTCIVGVDGCVDPTDSDRFLIEVSVDGITQWTIDTTVIDPAGNVGLAPTVNFRSDPTPTTVAITSPAAGSVVGLNSAGVSGTNVDVTIDAPAMPLNAAVTIVCTGAAGPGTSSIDASGQATATLDFSTALCTGMETTCTATVDRSGTPVTSAPVTFTVDLEAPTVTIVSPADLDTLFDPAVNVEVVTTCLEDGQQVDVSADTGAAGTASALSDAAIVNLSLSTGTHVLTATATDLAGNVGSSTPITIDIDADPPQVVFVSPANGLVLLAASDSSANPGYQFSVVIQVANKPDGVSVVLQVGYLDAGGNVVWRAPLPALSTAGSQVTFVDVDLPEGPILLRAVATGQSGLQGEGTISVTVSSGAPLCNLVQPVDGTSLGAPDDKNGNPADGVQVDVTLVTDIADGLDVELTVVDGEGTSTTLTVQASGGAATFVDVTLLPVAGTSHGQNTLDAICDPAGAAGVSLQSLVDIDLEAPVAVIGSPTDAAVFNLASADASAAPDFQILFVCTAADPSTGQSVKAGATGDLVVSCVGAAQENDPLTFVSYAGSIEARARPTLTDETNCTLTCTVTDLAGNQSAPVSVSVTVDRVAPSVTVVTPSDGSFYNDADDVSGSAGFQLDVRCDYTLADAGSTTGVLKSNSLPGDSRASAAPDYVTTGANEPSHTFAAVTLSDIEPDLLQPDLIDLVTIVCTIVDPAGNYVEAASTVTLDPTAPKITITQPDPATLPSCFNVFNDQDLGTAGLQTQVTVTTEGVADGQPLQLCSSADPGGGVNCTVSATYFLLAEEPVSNRLAVFVPVTFAELPLQTIIAEVQDLAGNAETSAPMDICVDVTPPDVTSLTIDTDTAGPAGTINAAEYAADGNQVCFTMTVVDADGELMTVETNNPVPGTFVGSDTVLAGTVTLCGSLVDGGHALTATVSDANGNPNRRVASPLIVDAEAEFVLIVDTLAPSVTITGPGAATLTFALDANQGTQDFDFDFAVSTSAENGQPVDFLVDGASVGTQTVAAGAATLTGQTLGQGNFTLRADVVDAAGNPGSGTLAVFVDTIVPVVDITAPGTGSSFNTTPVDFTITTTGSVGDQLVFIDDITSGTLSTGLTITGAGQTESLALSDATYDVFAQVTDSVGNVGTSVSTTGLVTVTVDQVGCAIAWTDPLGASVIYNLTDDEQPAAGLQTTIVANTTDCAGLTMDLYVGGVFDSTVTSSGAGDGTFLLNLADGATNVDVEVRITDGALNTTTDAFTVTLADVTAPTLARIAPLGAAFTYVAPTNRHIPAGVFAGTVVIVDELPATPDLEADFEFQVDGANGGTFTLDVGALNLVTQAITSASELVILGDQVISQDTIDTMTATVVDAAGNAASDSFPITVDVVAPGVPTVTPTLTDERAATVTLAWADPGDDGATGTATTYDLRWNTTGIAAQADFDAATADAIAFAPGTQGTPTHAVTPLPPLNDYYFALRVEDEVGNQSDLTNVVSQANFWTQITLIGGGFFGFRMDNVGDVNNDGYDDLVITAFNEDGGRGAIYVYYGNTPWPSADGLRQQILATDLTATAAGEWFGVEISAGDVDGDGIPDLLVSARKFDGIRGRAFILFGVDSSVVDCGATPALCRLDPTNFIEFRGTLDASAGDNDKFEFARTIGVVGDIDGDNIDDIVIPARGESVNGRAYVYYGRSQAAWATAMVSAQTSFEPAGTYVPTSAANLTFIGSAANDLYGDRAAIVDLGDLDGDGQDEFTIPASTIATLYVYDAGLVDGQIGDIDAAFGTTNVLTGTLPPVGPNMDRAFGHFALGVNLRGTARKDLVVAEAFSSRVHLYDTSAAGVGSNFVTLTRGSVSTDQFGYDLASGDINDDSLPDLIVGSNSTTAYAFTFYNTGSGTFFGTTPDSNIGPGGTGYGIAVDVGDYDASGQDDVLVADPVAGFVDVFY